MEKIAATLMRLKRNAGEMRKVSQLSTLFVHRDRKFMIAVVRYPVYRIFS